MKIIRPLAINSSQISTTAPSKNYPTWEPVGRDFSEDWGNLVMDAQGQTLCVCNNELLESAAEEAIRVYDLSTGDEVVQINHPPFRYVQDCKVSPDESKIIVAALGSSAGLRGYLYSLTTGDLIFSFECNVGSASGSRICWLADSIRFVSTRHKSESGNVGGSQVFRYFDTVDVWNSSNATVTIIDTYQVFRQSSVEGIPAIVDEWNYSVSVNTVDIGDSDKAFVSVGVRDVTQSGGARYAFARIDLGTLGASYSADNFNFGYADENQFKVKSIDARGHVFYWNAAKQELRIHQNTATLDNVLGEPIPAIYDGTIVSGIDYDSTSGLITISKTTGTRHKVFTASTYQSHFDLDPLIGQAPKYIVLSDKYYVYSKSIGGYGLVDIATGQLVTQTNPTVTAGDIYTYNNHNYEALTDNNDRPDLGAVADPPTWLDLGFINPLRMFDNKLDSLTTGPSPLVINITPGMLVNGIALFNVDASTVQITYTDPNDGLVYDTGQISMLDNSGVQDWYSFFFDPYLAKADLARVDLPAYIDGTVQITLDGAGADVAIGEVVLGTIYKIGDAQYGSSAGIIDFSRKETDQFGNFEIVPRRFSKRAEFDAVIPPAYGGSVQRTLARLRATPIVWIGSVDLEETIVYGYFREFDILLSNPAFSNVTITVEGL